MGYEGLECEGITEEGEDVQEGYALDVSLYDSWEVSLYLLWEVWVDTQQGFQVCYVGHAV